MERTLGTTMAETVSVCLSVCQQNECRRIVIIPTTFVAVESDRSAVLVCASVYPTIHAHNKFRTK